MNIPYDTYPREIEELVQEFAPIDNVVMPRDHSGMTRGYAFVYLKNAADVQKVIDYVDGRHIRSRQIRAKKSLVDPSKQQKQIGASTHKNQDKVTRENVDEYVRFQDHLRAKLRSDLLSHTTNNKQLFNDFVNKVAKSAEDSKSPFEEVYDECVGITIGMSNEDFRRAMKKYQLERIEMEERAIAKVNDPELEQNYPNLAYFKKLEAYMAELNGLSLADTQPHVSHQSHILVPPKIDTHAV